MSCSKPSGSKEDPIVIDSDSGQEETDFEYGEEDSFPRTPPPSNQIWQETENEIIPMEHHEDAVIDQEDLEDEDENYWQEAQNIFSRTGLNEDVEIEAMEQDKNVLSLNNFTTQEQHLNDNNTDGQVNADITVDAAAENDPYDADMEMVEQLGRGSDDVPSQITRNVTDLYTAELLEPESAFGEQVRECSFLITVNEGADAFVRADNSELYGLILHDIVAQHVLPVEESNFHVAFTVTPYEEDVAARDGQNVTPFYVAFKPAHQLTTDLLSSQIASRYQSGGARIFAPQNKLRVTVTTATYQQGSGRKRPDMKKLLNRQLELKPSITKKKTGLSTESYKNVTKNSVTKLCLGTAILQAIAYDEYKRQEFVSILGVELYKDKRNLWCRTRDISSANPGRCADLFHKARALLLRAGIYKESNFTIEDDVEQLQESLPDYTIVVMGEDHTDDPLYVGYNEPRRRIIGLLLKDGHFQFVKSVPTFMKTKFYCVACNVRGNNKMQHYKCSRVCQRCLTDSCPREQLGYSISCPKCSATFKHPDCFTNHQQQGPLGGKSYCNYTKRCKDCGDLYYTLRGSRHECNKSWCGRCKCMKEDDHQCFMKPAREPPETNWKRLYFDFETATYIEDGRHLHRVVAAVAFRSCEECHGNTPQSIEEAVDATCLSCCGDEKKLTIFEEISPENRHVNVIETFVKWLFRKQHAGFACVAHNLKSFDGQFVLREMMRNNQIRPANKLIVDGRKINGILMKNGQRLLDSYNFIPFGLATFPKAFGVQEWCKGEFPYTFIRPENYQYEGPVPDLSFYKVAHMKEDRAAAVERYHAEKVAENYVFNFYDEIMRYCITDVLLLAAGMTRFEEKFYNATNVILFEECLTAASAALATFRRRFLQEDAIELDEIPKGVSKRTLAVADRYLIWRAGTTRQHIHTRLNGGEHQIAGTNYFVDGWIPPCPEYVNGCAIEVKGCYHHACQLDYPDHQIMHGITTALDIRERDRRREEAIKNTGCELQIVWTHDITAQRKIDTSLDRALRVNISIGPLCPNEALFGGRVEGPRIEVVSDIFGRPLYCDVISLYPKVMKCDPYPIGPHRVIRGDEFTVPMAHPDDIEIFGIMSCAVRAPERLLLPVLPVKGKKLLFKLCGSCQSSEDGDCTHTGEARYLYGSWTTVELKLALEMGYVIEKVFAAQHYDEISQYLQEGGEISHSIFSEYVNWFLKFKQEASGLPRDQMTDDEILEYVEEYFNAEGVRLEVTNIFHDPVGRQVAKLLLNSLASPLNQFNSSESLQWGKLSERLDRRETACISRADELYRLLRNSRLEVFPGYIVGKKRMLVSYRTLEECQEPGTTHAMVHGVFTTSHARVRLYRAMLLLPNPQHLIYCDTDSLVYWAQWGEDPLKELYGQFLGQMTDEVGEGLYIDKFVTVGPKTYAFQVRRLSDKSHVRYVIKCKGFPLTRAAQEKICFEEMERIVGQALRGEEPTTLNVEYHTIARTAVHQLYNQVLRKQFRFTYDKRRIIAGGLTLPIGWKPDSGI